MPSTPCGFVPTTHCGFMPSTPCGLAPSFFIYFIINPLFARPEFSPKWGDVEEPLHYRARVSSRLSDASDFALRV